MMKKKKNPRDSTDPCLEWGRFDSRPITPDHILAAGRAFDRYLKTVGPREYVMRFLENGSVYLHSPAYPSNSVLLSLRDIIAESRDFWLSPRRSLWQHILKIWE